MRPLRPCAQNYAVIVLFRGVSTTGPSSCDAPHPLLRPLQCFLRWARCQAPTSDSISSRRCLTFRAGSYGWPRSSVSSLQKLGTILPALASTVLASIASSCTAAILAYVCAVLGSRSVGVGGPIPLAVRAIASLFRNIPVVAWAFILLFSFKQSEFTGFFALFLTSFGYLTRCFLESIDEMGSGPVEALRAAGASYGQIVAQAVIPMSITSVVSWVLYMIETNIRDATLIGLLTGTGIGFVFDVYYKSFRYDVAGLVILAIILAVVACELTSNYVRRKII